MPYPREHYLLAFGGRLFGAEDWSCTLRLVAPQAELTQAQEVAALASCVTAVKAFVGTSIFTPFTTLTWVKLNLINTEGRYDRSYTNLVDVLPIVQGTGTGGGYPAQVSVVATLTTPRQRGLAARGRMFLPGPSFALNSDGRLTLANANAIRDRVVALVTALEAVDGLGGVQIISNVREGAAGIVSGVTVGLVLDTMRSRRTSLKEDKPAPVAVQAALVAAGG